MSIEKLNRKKDYGTVFGDPEVGFVQDGNSYGHDGCLLRRGDVTPPPETKPPVDNTETVISNVQIQEDFIENIEEIAKKNRRSMSEATKKAWEAIQAKKDSDK